MSSRDVFYNIFRNRGITFILKPVLIILSGIYAFFIHARRIAYKFGIFRSFKLPLRVISVGNITMGGTGKTPMVITLADFFREKGKKVAISTRGYGGEYVKSPIALNLDTVSDNEGGYFGDEIYLFKSYLKNVPVFVGKDRVRIIKEALGEVKPHILILDDGFQHFRLKRDLDIVLVNSLNPFGNYSLIPSGSLREPLSSLKRADIFVITKSNLVSEVTSLKDFLRKINPSSLIACSAHLFKGLYEFGNEKEIDISTLRDKNIGAICAIGDPDSFEKLLKKEGFKIKISLRFLDHHIFDIGEIKDSIGRCLAQRIDTIITTEKDIFRLRDFLDVFSGAGIRLVFVKMELALTENKEAFFERVSVLFNN